MSSAARKTRAIKVEAPDPHNDRNGLDEVSSAPSRPAHEPSHAPWALPRSSKIFESVFDSLRHFCKGCEVAIALTNTTIDSCVMKWGTEKFTFLLDRRIDLKATPLAKILKKPDPYFLVEPSVIAHIDERFDQLRPGPVLIIPVDLASEGSALVFYWQPLSHGRLDEERIRSIKSILSLAGQAACAEDLSSDVQEHQNKLDTLYEELAEVQEFYRQYSGAISQCFWILDLDEQRVLVVSDNFEKVWGTSRSALASGLTGFMSSVCSEDRDRVLAEFHLQLGSTLDTELRVQGDDGEIRWIWLRGFPVQDAGQDHDLKSDSPASQSSRIVLIADDITDKKQEEELLRAREAQLVDHSRSLAVGDLATGVAHEINNPLTVIIGKADELKNLAGQGKASSKKIVEIAEKIQDTSVRISKIISSLKALAGREKSAAMNRVSFTRIGRELRDFCSEKFRLSGIHLEIPDFPETLIAEINETMISQMILNLINNAHDAVINLNERWVRVEYSEDQDAVYISVSDSGSGVPVKIRSRIFDPFFTTKAPNQGTGLGLSLAASIARHHNGSLRLNTLHQHTCFVIQLPKRQPKASRSAA